MKRRERKSNGLATFALGLLIGFGGVFGFTLAVVLSLKFINWVWSLA